MRSIIYKVFRRVSPFDGLVLHAEKVLLGVNKLKEAISFYFAGNYDDFDKLAEEIIAIENDADVIKGNVRNHLHKGIFMPVDRGDFLDCLKQQDSILDSCEDIVIWLQFRKTEINELFKRQISEYLSKIIRVVEDLESMVKDVHKLISSTSATERREVKDKIKNIHFEESEIDMMQKNLIKELFSTDKDMMHFYHLIHVVFLLGRIGDYAENVGDKLRVMMAR
jgi:predicted phosphate transport protein (TIGR00153 family)